MIASRCLAWSSALAPSGHPALRTGTGSGPGQATGNRAGATTSTPAPSTYVKDYCPCRFVVVVSACL